MHAPNDHFYYGWVVVGISAVTLMLVLGTFASSGVLFAALVKEYGWSRATTSLPFGLALLGYCSTAWFAGHLLDRLGPRRLFPMGAVCLGVGLLTTARAETAWQLCLTWGVLVGQGFTMAGFVTHLSLVSQWFQRRRGTALGVALSGASLGTLILVPATQFAVERWGWRTAYTTLALVVMGCVVPLTAIWQRHRPADLGLRPDGATASEPAREPALHPAGPQTLLRHLAGVLRGHRFWCLFVLTVGMGWMANVVVVHQIAHMTDNGFPAVLAATLAGVIGLLRVVACPIWGVLSDRFQREAVLAFGSGLCIVGFVCLAALRPGAPVALLYVYTMAFGLGYGVHSVTEAASAGDIFHGPHMGAVLGALEFGWGLGGFCGSWLGGSWYDHWGSYNGVYALTVGLCICGVLAVYVAAPRRFRALTPASTTRSG